MNISEHETQRLVAAEKDRVKISVTISDQTKAKIRKDGFIIEGEICEEMKDAIEKLVDSAARKVFCIPPEEKPNCGRFAATKKEVHVCVSLHFYVAKED